MKVVLFLALLAASAVIANAVSCITTSYCQDERHSHMTCKASTRACINRVCTCYTPSGNGTTGSQISCVSGGREDCFNNPKVGCSDARRHCVDGTCVCTNQ